MNLNKYLLLLCLLSSFINCGDTGMLKEPSFRVYTEKYENSSNTPVFLASKDDSCKPFMHKRIHNILFVLPMNSFNAEEIQEISKRNMVRYKNVMQIGDILWTTALFLTSIITYSVEVDECDSKWIALSSDEMHKLKNDANKEKDLSLKSDKELNEIRTELKLTKEDNDKLRNELNQMALKARSVSENPDEPIKAVQSSPKIPKAPLLINYEEFFDGKNPGNSKNFAIYFPHNNDKIDKNGESRAKLFSEEYKNNYSEYKIMLIGHSDWKGGVSSKNLELSLKRVKAVKDILIKLKIADDKIFTTASGSYWPGNNEEKQGREFNRRVDIVLTQ